MCKEHLNLVYRSWLSRTGSRVEFLEQSVAFSDVTVALSEDDRRNEPTTYAHLFSAECRIFLEGIYDRALEMMRGRPLDACGDVLKGLEFLQEVVATAIWRYRCDVGQKLDAFAREFDRLDVPTERARLHGGAQLMKAH